MLLSFLLTVPPVIVLVYGLTRCSFFGRPGARLWLAAAFGILAALPSGLINVLVAEILLDGDTNKTGQPLLNALTYDFLVVGPNEEFFKLIALIFFIRFFDLHRSHMIIVASGLAIGLGFAGIENWQMVEIKENTAVQRAVIIPAHPMLTGCAAIFLCMGKLRDGIRWRYWTCALLVPSFLHGAINASNMIVGSPVPPFGIVLSFLCAVFFGLLVQLKRYHNLVFFEKYEWKGAAYLGFGSILIITLVVWIEFASLTILEIRSFYKDEQYVKSNGNSYELIIQGFSINFSGDHVNHVIVLGSIVAVFALVASIFLIRSAVQRILLALDVPEVKARLTI